MDTSKFIEGTVDSGKINDTLYGINAGVNCLVVLANPKIFEKAGWTCPTTRPGPGTRRGEIGAEVASKAGAGPSGSRTSIVNDVFQAWILRQQGKELFTADGLGLEAGDVRRWFD